MVWTLIITSFIATSVMTLFSYIVSWITQQPYKEPLLLAVLLNNFHVSDNKTSRTIGWSLHYLLGLLFVLAYDAIVRLEWLPISWTGALLYGTIIGIIGIIGWIIMFRMSYTKPKMSYRVFYTQLFVAHVIFALATAACYLWMLSNTAFFPNFTA